LVAVSKLKPANDILALHQAPISHTHFGENYLQELQEKSRLLPPTIQWHFIGGLQSNKCQPLASSVPNLFCVSSVDSSKKADQLEKGRSQLVEKESLRDKLHVHIQVNTSGEEEKSGVEPSEAVELCRHVRENCPHLHLAGLMTIGALARSQATTTETENEDFLELKKVRFQVAEKLDLEKDELELSMGMSEDYEGAIALGSDEVRVGSTLFGQRPAKKDAKIKEDSN
jgi:pyridoxal phosphate enzyme (YggS family)